MKDNNNQKNQKRIREILKLKLDKIYKSAQSIPKPKILQYNYNQQKNQNNSQAITHQQKKITLKQHLYRFPVYLESFPLQTATSHLFPNPKQINLIKRRKFQEKQNYIRFNISSTKLLRAQSSQPTVGIRVTRQKRKKQNGIGLNMLQKNRNFNIKKILLNSKQLHRNQHSEIKILQQQSMILTSKSRMGANTQKRSMINILKKRKQQNQELKGWETNLDFYLQ